MVKLLGFGLCYSSVFVPVVGLRCVACQCDFVNGSLIACAPLVSWLYRFSNISDDRRYPVLIYEIITCDMYSALGTTSLYLSDHLFAHWLRILSCWYVYKNIYAPFLRIKLVRSVFDFLRWCCFCLGNHLRFALFECLSVSQLDRHAVLLLTPTVCCAINLSYYWLKEKTSFQVCHTETSSALWFPCFLSI